MAASLPRSSWPRFSPSALRPSLSTAKSTAGAGGATEACDTALLSMRARHACVCVPVPFWHLGQPIEAPNFLTIASVMCILRPLALMGVFAMSAQSSSGCGGVVHGLHTHQAVRCEQLALCPKGIQQPRESLHASTCCFLARDVRL